MSQPVDLNALRIPQHPQNSHAPSSKDQDPSNPLSGRVSEIDSQGVFLLTSTVSIIMGIAVGFFCQMPMISILCSLMGCVNAIVHDRAKIQKKYNDVFPEQSALLVKASAERTKILEKEIGRLTEECSSKDKGLQRVEGWHTSLSLTVTARDEKIKEITKERDQALDKSQALQPENDRLKTERAAIQQLDEKLKLITLEKKLSISNEAFEKLERALKAMNEEMEQKQQRLLELDEAIAARSK